MTDKIKHKGSNSRYRRLKYFIVAIVVLLLPFILFGCDINLPGETNRAYQKWQNANISSYKITYVFGSMADQNEVRLTVEDNELTRIDSRPHLFGDSTDTWDTIKSSPDWYDPMYSGFFLPDLSHYTVDGLLDYWQQADLTVSRPLVELCNSEMRYDVDFNAEMGFIENLSYNNCGTHDLGMGLLCSVASDCYIGMHVREFTSLIESE